jgi:hypothetical protein
MAASTDKLRWLQAGCAGACAACVAVRALAMPPSYRLESIGTGLQAAAMNERGDVVGRQLSGQSVGHAFFAPRGGAIEPLPVPAPWVSSDAYQLNGAGLVVGAVSMGSIASIGSQAAAWRHTGSGWQFELLQHWPGDQYSTATGVNSHGDIVGGSGGIGLGMYSRAVRFTATGAQLLPDLSLPAGVNDDRVVLAWNTLLNLDTMVSTTIPLPPGNWQGVVSTDFSNSGAFCGYILGFSGCSTFPVRYRPGHGWDFIGGCATTTSATSINDQGDAVAYVYNGGNWVSFVGEPNLSLDTLIDAADGTWAVTGALEINSRRMVLATARRGPSFAVMETVRLVPVMVADLNSDGHVDGTDLSILLAAWGHSGTPADLDGSGVVDGLDLSSMLAAWG